MPSLRSQPLYPFPTICTIHSQAIHFVCMNEQCNKSMLCCTTCIDENHCKHEIISLNKFETILKQTMQTIRNNKDKKKITKVLNKYQNDFGKVLKQLENVIIVKIQQMEDQLNTIFRDMNMVLNPNLHQDIIQSLHKDPNNFSRIHNEIKLSSKYKFGTITNVQTIVNYQLSQFVQKIKQIKKDVQQKLTKMQKQIQNINFNSMKYSQQTYFHQHFKNHDLKRLDKSSLIQKASINNNSRSIALANHPLDPVNNQTKFRIVQNGIGIPSVCFGLASLSSAKQNQFANWRQWSKGIYGIDQAYANSWGSIQQSQVAYQINQDTKNQYVQIGFTFNQGDIIIMEVDFESKCIFFMKDGTDDIHEITANGLQRDMYPFVCLMNEGAIVQIMQ